MTEIQIGDRVSIELIVTKAADIIEARLPFRDGVSDLVWEGISAHRTFFTLLRRAPVDLAACELPVDVLHKTIGPGVLKDRCGPEGWVEWPDGSKSSALMSNLRPLDAPAPDAGKYKVPEGQTPLDDNLSHRLIEVFSEGVKSRDTGASSPYHGQSLEHCLHASGWVQRDLRLALDKAMDAPTCPPGHIMIGDRAVPEPMLVVPEIGVAICLVTITDQNPVFFMRWNNSTLQNLWLERGLIHSTEANARAHAEAIIALSAGDGV